MPLPPLDPGLQLILWHWPHYCAAAAEKALSCPLIWLCAGGRVAAADEEATPGWLRVLCAHNHASIRRTAGAQACVDL